MPQRDVVVVGASAGGLEALIQLLRPIPADLPACFLVVLHTPASGVNALASILARGTALKVVPAEAETTLRPGTVIVAHPDHHLLVVDGQAILTRGPREHGHRPAIDVLFRSAAQVLGPRVIGVVLSGAMDDGSSGLVAIRDGGGVAMVQDPLDAAQPSMPAHAIAAADPGLVLSADEMAAHLQRLVGEPSPDGEGTSLPEPNESKEPSGSEAVPDPQNPQSGKQSPGNPNGLPCPTCSAPLTSTGTEGKSAYRCPAGHTWSIRNLLASNAAALDGALRLGMQSLEEKARLAEAMSERAGRQDQALAADRFSEHAAEARTAADLIRQLLLTQAGREHTTRPRAGTGSAP